MEEKDENVVEETTTQNQQDPGDEHVEKVDESKFESAGDDSIIKVDLSKPPKPEEKNEEPKKSAEVEGMKGREREKEDRKDERTKIQATQQSELIDQRNSGKPPKNFESAGNDILGGGFDLGSFDPS